MEFSAQAYVQLAQILVNIHELHMPTMENNCAECGKEYPCRTREALKESFK